jgi:hypothetical protein
MYILVPLFELDDCKYFYLYCLLEPVHSHQKLQCLPPAPTDGRIAILRDINTTHIFPKMKLDALLLKNLVQDTEASVLILDLGLAEPQDPESLDSQVDDSWHHASALACQVS